MYAERDRLVLGDVAEFLAIGMSIVRNQRPPDLLEGLRLLALLPRLSNLPPAVATPGDSFRLPPLRNGFRLLFDEYLANSNVLVSDPDILQKVVPSLEKAFQGYKPTPSVMKFTDTAGAAAARKRIETHPEGTLKTLYAFRLYELADKTYLESGRDDSSRDAFAEAGRAFEDAARTPGVGVDPTLALEQAYLSHAFAGVDAGTQRGRPAALSKACALLRERLQTRPPLRSPGQFTDAVTIARWGKEYRLARGVLDDWNRVGSTNTQYLVECTC